MHRFSDSLSPHSGCQKNCRSINSSFVNKLANFIHSALKHLTLFRLNSLCFNCEHVQTNKFLVREFIMSLSQTTIQLK